MMAARTPRPAMPWLRPGRLLPGLAMLLAILAADQLSKWWVLYRLDLPERGQVVILPVLNFSMVWNHGVTFGLLNGFGHWGPVLLGGMAVAVVLALVAWMARADRWITSLALGAIAGGAIGNVIDRVRFGAVVDFIHAHIGPVSWYVFNVADAAICCGVAALLLEGLLPRPDAAPRAAPVSTPVKDALADPDGPGVSRRP